MTICSGLAKNIQHSMTSDVILQTRNSLLRISSDVGALLKKHGALTPKRSASPAAVSSELGQAASGAKNGDNLAVWAAFVRAHGHINDVVGDAMTKWVEGGVPKCQSEKQSRCGNPITTCKL